MCSVAVRKNLAFHSKRESWFESSSWGVIQAINRHSKGVNSRAFYANVRSTDSDLQTQGRELSWVVTKQLLDVDSDWTELKKVSSHKASTASESAKVEQPAICIHRPGQIYMTIAV